MNDFRAHLQRQLDFLQRSGAAYDAGCRDETYRIATAIRVLIHNTEHSISLLHHLDAESVPLLSTTEPASPGAVFYDGLSLIVIGDSASAIRPALDQAHTRRFISTMNWWTEEGYVLNQTRLCRSKIVLSAANQDGGAHVDATLNSDYAQLKQGIWHQSDNSEFIYDIPEPQLVFLRQMAYELVNSPALNDLVQCGAVRALNKIINLPTPVWTSPPALPGDLAQLT